jgi:hypothetical protein
VRAPTRTVAGWALFIGGGIGASLAAAQATKAFDQFSPATASAFGFTVTGFVLVAAIRPRAAIWSAARWCDSTYFGLAVLVGIILLYLAFDRLLLGADDHDRVPRPLGLAGRHARAVSDYLAAGCALGGSPWSHRRRPPRPRAGARLGRRDEDVGDAGSAPSLRGRPPSDLLNLVPPPPRPTSVHASTSDGRRPPPARIRGFEAKQP